MLNLLNHSEPADHLARFIHHDLLERILPRNPDKVLAATAVPAAEKGSPHGPVCIPVCGICTQLLHRSREDA